MRIAAPGLLAVALAAPTCSNASIAEVSVANAGATPNGGAVTEPTTTTITAPGLGDAPTATRSEVTTADSSTGTESPGNDSPGDEDQIRAVIDLYWHALVNGMDPPDPDHDVWETVAAGARLEELRATAAQKRDAGEANRYRGKPHPLVTRAELVGLNDGLAIVNLCVFDDTLLVDVETGEILDDDLRLGWLQHLVELTPDGWRVIRTLLIERHDTAAQCDSAF